MIKAEHRESLAYALSEAAELEHGLMCCYLYAAFSIGKRAEQRYPAHAAALARWRAEIVDVARDEMVHLALVSNLLNALGVAPHLTRPNFPVSAGAHPAGIVVSLAPFSLATIQHFVYLERPDDVVEREGAGFVNRGYERMKPAGRLVPSGQDYGTLGDLYRWISEGFATLTEQLGAAKLFCGDPRIQLVSSSIGLPGIHAVTDLASAQRAIELIVTQGEGAPHCPGNSHYSRFSAIRRELEAIQAADPTFEPAAQVARNPLMRRPADFTDVVWVDAEPAASVLDVANATYALMLRSLGVLHSQVATSPAGRALAVEASTLTMRALTPVAELLTELPASTRDADVRAGLTFTVSRSLHALPEARDAWRSLHEGAAAIASGLRTHVVALDPSLAAVADRLDGLAARLLAASEQAAATPTTIAAPPPPALRPPASYTPGAIEEACGEKLTIHFETKRCIHARHCVLGAPRVFLANVQGPWIYPDEMEAESLVHIARSCPSGAITYARSDGGAAEPAPDVNEIRVRENGPYAVRADVELAGHGHLLRATLCRCGASNNKPFCDGSHNAIEFKTTGEPVSRESTPLAQRGGCVEIRPQADGPLVVAGNVEICCNTGRTIDRVTTTRLCRCGGSSTKPFCDGTHARIGFRAPGA